MARQREYQGTAATTIRGGYVPFMLNRDSHLDVYQNAVGAINEQHEKALEARGRIKDAIDKIDLHSSENQWKQNYLNGVLKQIDNEARYGGYSTALSKATELAQSAASDPALLGRAKYYQQWKEWNKELDQRGDISETTKRWAKTLGPNKYAYEDIRDSSGTVVGGKEFDNTRKPVADLDWAAEQGKIAALARASSTASQTSTSNYTNGTGGSSATSSSREAITEKQLMDGFNKWYETNYDKVFQDWEVMGFELQELDQRANDESLSDIEREKAAQQYKELKSIYDTVEGSDLHKYAAYRLAKGSYASIMAYSRTTSGRESKHNVTTPTGGTGDDAGSKAVDALIDLVKGNADNTSPAAVVGAPQEQDNFPRIPTPSGGRMK